MTSRGRVVASCAIAMVALGCRRKPPPPPIVEGVYECASDSDCVMNDFACCSHCKRPTAYSKKALREEKQVCQPEDCASFENDCPAKLESVDAFVAVCRAQKCVTEPKKKQ